MLPGSCQQFWKFHLSSNLFDAFLQFNVEFLKTLYALFLPKKIVAFQNWIEHFSQQHNLLFKYFKYFHMNLLWNCKLHNIAFA